MITIKFYCQHLNINTTLLISMLAKIEQLPIPNQIEIVCIILEFEEKLIHT
jgi:hypothetical protein